MKKKPSKPVTPKTLDQAWDKGFDEGFEDGFNSGCRAGLAEASNIVMERRREMMPDAWKIGSSAPR